MGPWDSLFLMDVACGGAASMLRNCTFTGFTELTEVGDPMPETGTKKH
jgi:hypothetical protein